MDTFYMHHPNKVGYSRSPYLCDEDLTQHERNASVGSDWCWDLTEGHREYELHTNSGKIAAPIMSLVMGPPIVWKNSPMV
jgi:hypothetical protein